MPAGAPTTVAFPRPLPAERDGDAWRVEVDGRALRATNLGKVLWGPEGFTKADLLGYYYNAAGRILPYLSGRPLTMKRMPDGADGAFFYAKQAPEWTPEWVRTVPVRSRDSGKVIDYVVAEDTASLLWLANLACIEVHPWHSRADDLGHPDYAFFDLDPMGAATFDQVREVALLVRTVLDQLDLRSYPRTSGATGMQIFVPIERVHTDDTVVEVIGRLSRMIARADPQRATMAARIADRGSKVFLDHVMNVEGRNIASAWSVRPERAATVATPLTWAEVDAGVTPADFTIATVWERRDHSLPLLDGGQDLRAAARTLGIDAALDRRPPGHEVGGSAGTPAAAAVERSRTTERSATAAPPAAADLDAYRRKRDFARTSEPPPEPAAPPDDADTGAGAPDLPRFVIQHHLATRLHHDLRLEHRGALPSWAIPKGLPDVRGLRHLAVRTEDHPLAYLDYEGDIPDGEYGAGPMRIWDRGTYDLLAWGENDLKIHLHGSRHTGEWHLFRTERDWLVIRADTDVETPPPPTFSPMLASEGAGPFDSPDWLFEVKWDGVRVLATVVRPHAGDAATVLRSRAGNDVTAGYPELAGLWERVLARNAVLDGEVVVLGPDGRPSFQLLQQRMHVREPKAVRRLRDRHPVTYLVFDVLAVDGEPLVDRTLDQRLTVLDELLVPGRHVRRSDPVAGDGIALYEAVVGNGLEGVVAKRRSSRYRPGRRSQDWRKLKVRRTACAVVGGWLPGEGARSGRLGSLLVGAYEEGDLVFAGRAGTGFDAAELERLHDLLGDRASGHSPFTGGPDLPKGARFVEPDLVCRVEYTERTDGGLLRAPAYKGLVDADPRTVLLDDL